MPNNIRIAQFMPFDSLKGFKEAIKEKERVVVEQGLLSPDLEEDIDLKLHQIKVSDMVNIVYKSKNDYVNVTGLISKIDLENHYLKVVKEKIQFKDIYSLNIL